MLERGITAINDRPATAEINEKIIQPNICNIRVVVVLERHKRVLIAICRHPVIIKPPVIMLTIIA